MKMCECKKGGLGDMPELSFVIGICAHNEKEGVGLLIPRLLQENYQNTLDSIIVVSTASTDGTNDIVRSLKDDRIDLILEDERKGKYTAVNEIIRRAKSKKVKVIVMIPADVLPKVGAIDLLVSKFQNEEVGCVSARPVVRNTNSVVEKIGLALWELHNETFLYHSEKKTVSHATGEMMAVRTEIMEELPRIIVDDAYMAGTALKKGFRVIYDPTAEVMIWVPTKFSDLWKQRKRNLQGLKHLDNFGISLQTLTYSNPFIILLVIFKLMKRAPRLFPFICIIAIIEILGVSFAFLPLPQTVVWDMITTAKPKSDAIERMGTIT
ncbi:MAG: glycosyltransferase [Candidatus Thorarchaeota archaeon]|nr:MAG: glycosyltransferase [Candidatus Thorarchaeota archaeon]